MNTPQPPNDNQPSEPTIGHAEYRKPEVRTIGSISSSEPIMVDGKIHPDAFNALLVEKLREENRKLRAELKPWFKAADNLPDCSQRVLVFIPPCNIQTGYLLSGKLWSTGIGFRDFKDVSHWMPLPQPPSA